MKTIYSLLLSLLLLAGCRKTDLELPGGVDGEVKLALNFGKHEDGHVAEFSLAQNGANSDAISDLNLFVFDPSGNLLNQSFYTSVGSGVNIQTTSGQRTICAVANYGSQITGITTQGQLMGLSVSAPTPSGMVNANNNFVMVKQTGLITIPAPSTPGGTVVLDPILLDRLTAKVTVTIDKSDLNAGVVITPLKIALRQVPNACTLVTTNAPTSTSGVIFQGDSIAAVSEIISTNHNTAIPLYVYENMQGMSGPNTDQTQKTPPAGKEKLATYVEITADYVSPDKQGTVVYRYWLGTNTTTNFSVLRNTWYQISIAFHGRGAITENTWRVNVAGLNDLFMPTALYFPWCGGRVQVYNLSTLSTSSTLGNLLQSGASVTLKDSLAYVMTKSDNTSGTPIAMGSLTGGTAVYNLAQRNKGSMELSLDVSQLSFPKNSTFGLTNYPITKYIRIYGAGSDLGTWRARASANWVYLGDGANFQSFTSAGVAAPTGTAGMLNKNAGALPSTPTMTSIAVRCSDNNTAVTRMATIVFFSQNGRELARVFVTQNPSTYPKAPTGLAYIPGGVFKPGAFKGGGSEVSSTPANVSNKELWMKINAFYLTANESTVQEFCDYLNDLGVTTATPMVGGLLGTLLGGGGSIADYPGGAGLLDILLGSTPVFTGSAGPVLSAKWAPASASVAVNSSSATNVSVPIPNYPMNNITFYGAYDYGYWMNKFSDRGAVTRVSTYGLPTEMEWEAAARGITNGLATKDAFDNNGNSQKNGAYPYPFPANSLNGSWTGGETSELIGLKSVSWYSGGNWNLSTGAAAITSSYLHPSGNLVPNIVGLYDMGGNVAEWNVDIYNYAINLAFNIGGLLTGSIYLTNPILATGDRMVRGGGNTGTAAICGVANRQHYPPSTTSTTVGFRAVIH